jgi:hypothetical protein
MRINESGDVQRLRAALTSLALVVDLGAALGADAGFAFQFQRGARTASHDYLEFPLGDEGESI